MYHQQRGAIINLRMEDVTLEDTAKEAGFKTHSAVLLKRLKQIGKLYRKRSAAILPRRPGCRRYSLSDNPSAGKRTEEPTERA